MLGNQTYSPCSVNGVAFHVHVLVTTVNSAWELKLRVQQEDAPFPILSQIVLPRDLHLQAPLSSLRPQVEARSWLGLRSLVVGVSHRSRHLLGPLGLIASVPWTAPFHRPGDHPISEKAAPSKPSLHLLLLPEADFPRLMMACLT